MLDQITYLMFVNLVFDNCFKQSLFKIDYTEKFDIEQRARGQFMVLSRSTLQLPRYPSSFNETYLYMTVLCNNQAYPLITVRVRNFNSFSPKFYNEPYEVVLPGVCICHNELKKKNIIFRNQQ